jgi:hypothetical protein
MSTRPLRTSTLEQRKAADAVAAVPQRAQQRSSTHEASARKQDAPGLRSTKKRTLAEAQLAETVTADTDEAMQEGEQHEGAEASDSAALHKQLAELAQLVRQQADEHQRESERQRELIAQLRAAPAHSPQHSVSPSPQCSPAHSPQHAPRSIAPAAAAAAAAVPESAASQSRFARKEPRAQDLQEYDGASGAKLDDWLKQLAMAARLYHLTAQEAVDFAGSRLRGAALDWWLALGDDELAAIADREALAAALRARFQPVTAARTAREQLDKLQQGGRGINEYIADFQRLTTQIGMASLGQENALYAFERGLRRELAVELRKQGVATLQEAIALTARIGGLMQSSAAPQGRQSLNQMDVDDSSGASLDQRIQQAVLNAMQSQGSNGMGAKMQTQRGYSQEREQRGGGRGGRGGQSGGRGGRFGQRSGPPVVPGVPESVVRQRLDAQQCVRCGGEGHRSTGCPNAISASGN